MNTRIERVKLAELRPLELNARSMRHETFAALVANLKRDGALTSVPLAVKDDDGRYTILSGNHRVAAAIAAGIDEADVMLTDDPMTTAQRIAVQLSHNALAGEDDPATLRLLYDQVDDIDWRAYSGLDDSTLALLAEVSTEPLTDENVEWLTVTLVLLPDELERLEAAWKSARAIVAGDRVYLARYAEYDRILDALDAAGRSFDVRNTAAALMIVLDIYEAHREDLAVGWRSEKRQDRVAPRVPLVSLFGADELPPGAARLVDRAVTDTLERRQIQHRWEWLELVARAQLEAAKEPA